MSSDASSGSPSHRQYWRRTLSVIAAGALLGFTMSGGPEAVTWSGTARMASISLAYAGCVGLLCAVAMPHLRRRSARRPTASWSHPA
jgi:hypothetical protein